LLGRLVVKVPFEEVVTTGEQARITSSQNERELDESSTRRDYDHRKLRLLGSPPGLRLVGMGTNLTEVLSGVTRTTGNYGCPAAHPDYVYSKWTQTSGMTTDLLGVSIRRAVKIRVAIESRKGVWSSVRSGYDHRKLRLLGSPPGLRLAELNASSVAGHDFIRSGHEYCGSARSEYKPRRQSPSCHRTYTPIPNRKTLPKADIGQSTSTRSGHKPLALPEVCTKHFQREYACRNRDLAVLLTN
jgi:hypothetical protein